MPHLRGGLFLHGGDNVMWHRSTGALQSAARSPAVAVIDFLLRKLPEHWLPTPKIALSRGGISSPI